MSIHTPKPHDANAADGPIPLRPLRARKPKLGLALGAGAARGWSHIGVILELEAQGLLPDIVVGTSIGAVVGGCYAAERLEALQSFALGLTKKSVFSLMDLSFSGVGLLGGGRLKTRLDQELNGRKIETLPKKFAAVAT